ncbi:hypothetical protein DS885_03955 [Psychromonas sp. B3M02]|uniref:conjugal transfer protein TraG N-terminal domain-containing protein n=1 Tax=Psychromonas sp. B3M02 TaxID=2267226 RepID=UPI000DEA9035|nr:conjugal transfer protein TraG N-terminal domain-containing protein [Psychromonas sp. B3M02]RBW47311.1 hypothetical protein DS885_03955 [Psychromonas sp. B3M02]
MGTDSYLEMFTLLYSWQLYGTIWGVLEATGVLLLPFIGMVFDHLANYGKSDTDDYSEKEAQSNLLGEMVLACIVIMLCGVPYLSFDATDVNFTPSSMVNSASQSSYDIASNDSTYGEGLSFSDYPLDVEVPPFWWFVHDYSLGITHAIMTSLSAPVDIREYIETLKKLEVKDPETRAELQDFRRDCYVKALSKYKSEKPNETGNYVTDINNILDAEGQNDPYWEGSHIYLSTPGYYDSIRAEVIVEGFPYNSSRDVEWDPTDPDVPDNGKPYCDNWWANSNGLREKIYDDISWAEIMHSTVASEFGVADQEDILLTRAIAQSPESFTPRGYDFNYSNSTYGNGSFTSEVNRHLKQFAGLVGGGVETVTNSVVVSMLLNAAPMAQAILLLLIVMFIPFVLLLTSFSIKGVLIITWALFSFRFLSACWMIAWWLDQNILASIFPSGSIPFTVIDAGGVTQANRNLILMYMLNYLYIAIPLVFAIISGWSGYNVIRGLQAGALTGGLGAAGGRMASGAMRGASKGISNIMKSFPNK